VPHERKQNKQQRAYTTRMMNIGYTENVDDRFYWCANALYDFFTTRVLQANHFDIQNGEFLITKGIHPDKIGLHFNFIYENTTYHAYTHQKVIIMNGITKSIGVVVDRLTFLTVNEIC